MNIELESFQRDIYIRYQLLTELVKEYRQHSHQEAIPVLDVGSGDLPITQTFLGPDFAVSGCDTTVHATDSSVHALNGVGLPYEDSSFPVVIAMDVLEHVNSDQREHFLSEMRRVSSELVIVAFPQASTVNLHYERYFQQLCTRLTGAPNQFLSEHAEFGLPCAESVKELLSSSDCHTLSFGSFPTSTWYTQTAIDFCYSFLGLSREKDAFNKELNTNDTSLVSDQDFYRSFVVASTDSALLDKINKKLKTYATSRIEPEIEALANLKRLLSQFHLSITSALSDDSLTSTELSPLKQLLQEKVIPSNDFLLGTFFESAVYQGCSATELQMFSDCSDPERIALINKIKNSSAELTKLQAAENEEALRERILNTAEELELVRKENEVLISDLNRKSDENTALSADIHKLTEELDSMERDNTTLHGDLFALTQELIASKVKNTKVSNSLDQTRASLELSQGHTEKIANELSVLTMEIQLRDLTVLHLKQSLSWRVTKVFRYVYGAFKKPNKNINNEEHKLS